MNLKPFVTDLPFDQTDYFEILNKSNAARMISGFVTLKPGEEVGIHNTEDYEELIVVLEGSGVVVTEGDGERAVRIGQVAYNPPHSEHNVKNTGKSLLRYIYIVSNAE